MNGARLTTQVVQHIEEYGDRYLEAVADGVITPEEDQELREQGRRVYALSMDVDEAIGLTVTMLRRGPDSVSLKRRMVERGIRLQKTEENSKVIDIRTRTPAPDPDAA